MTLIKQNDGLFPSLWNDFLDSDLLGNPGIAQAGTSIPAVNIKDEADGYVIEMAVPDRDWETDHRFV